MLTPALVVAVLTADADASPQWMSVLGDPRMQSQLPSTSYTGWNFCNGAAAPSGFPTNPSPRLADCPRPEGGNRISPADNALGLGQPIPGQTPTPTDADRYARAKERYLRERCSQPAANRSLGNQSGWQVMFKSVRSMASLRGLSTCTPGSE